jgi:transposase
LRYFVVAKLTMRKSPEAIDISEEQYSELVKRVEGKNLSDEDWRWILAIVRAYGLVVETLRNQKVTLQKLKQLLFGKKTEKGQAKDKTNQSPSQSGTKDPGGPTEPSGKKSAPTNEAHSSPSNEAEKTNEPVQALSAIAENMFPNSKPITDPQIKPGHGQRGHKSWKNAVVVSHAHTTFSAGGPCPKCPDGKLYIFKEPAVWVRIIGQPPLTVEVNQLERLRCNPCGELFTAKPPEELVRNPKSTPEARATAAIIKYQAATPFNRFAEIEKNFGCPIPRTRIWMLCQELADSVRPVVNALIVIAAQGHLVQNDDTRVRILQLMKENKTAKNAGVELDRVGMYTTAVVSKVGEHKIVLFFSSRKHAGENLDQILALRNPDLPPPTQVCDASSMNTTPGKDKTEIAGCHDHYLESSIIWI